MRATKNMIKEKNNFILLLLVILFLISGNDSIAQGNMVQSNQMRLGTGIVRIAEAGQIADSVNVWGDVQNSGRFLLPRGTTLTDLISYAGGPVLFRSGDVVIDWSVIKLNVTITTINEVNQKEFKQYTFMYSNEIPNEFSNYKLKNNDVVVFQVKRKRNWRDYLQVIGPIATTLMTTILLYDRIQRTF